MKHLMYVSLICMTALTHCHTSGYEEKTVAVIGTGYVGLITAVGLADFGHRIFAVDIDAHKIAQLNQRIIPIYEPGLDELAECHMKSGRISFTTDIKNAIQKADIIFIAVGTPMASDGAADLSAVDAVAETIRDNLNEYKVIVIKSTVPIGTGARIRKLIETNPENKSKFDMVFQSGILA